VFHFVASCFHLLHLECRVLRVLKVTGVLVSCSLSLLHFIGIQLVPCWSQSVYDFWLPDFRAVFPLFLCELKQANWKSSPCRHPGSLASQLVKVSVFKSLKGMRSLFWVIDQEARNEPDSLRVCIWFEHLFPGNSANLRESMLFIVGVHRFDLVLARCA